jgi:hypothetical protein
MGVKAVEQLNEEGTERYFKRISRSGAKKAE